MRIWAIFIFVFTLFAFGSALSFSEPATDDDGWFDLNNVAHCAEEHPVAYFPYALPVSWLCKSSSPWFTTEKCVCSFLLVCTETATSHHSVFYSPCSSNFHQVNEDSMITTLNALFLGSSPDRCRTLRATRDARIKYAPYSTKDYDIRTYWLLTPF